MKCKHCQSENTVKNGCQPSGFITLDETDFLKFKRKLGGKEYELTNHLGNVMAVVTDRKITVQGSDGSCSSGSKPMTDFYIPNVVSYSDYYPFGMQMPDRNDAVNSYRYKHQGQESDPEIYGEGNSYAYTYRMSDARLGRFWSIDPLAPQYAYNSPYAYSENRLIDGIELEGLEYVNATEKFTKVVDNPDGTQSSQVYEFGSEFGDLFQSVEHNGETYYDVGRPIYRKNDGRISLDMYNKDDELVSDLVLGGGQTWLNTAKGEHGINEAENAQYIVNNYHAVNKEFKPKTAIGVDGAWCASFAGYCLTTSGFNAQLDAGAWSYAHMNEYSRKDGWGKTKWGQKLTKPAIGAIAVYENGNEKHVGFVVGKSSNDKYIYLLGGNQGDMVKISKYRYNKSNFTFSYPSNYTISPGDYNLPIWNNLLVNPSNRTNESTR